MSIRRRYLFALAATALLGAAGAQDDGDDLPRAFQVYDTPGVRGRVRAAREHLEAQRWSEALVDLQALLEEHRGEVLSATRPPLRSGRGASGQPVHGGAAEWATRTLASLPAEARALYEERHGARAARALAAALTQTDRAALAGVARRFPLTREAVRAWWALGDLELERGDVEVGLAAWARGLASLLDRAALDATDALAWRGALEELEARGDARALAAVAPRAAIALARLDGQGELAALAARDAAGTVLSPGGDLGRLGRDPDTWPRRFDLPRGADNPFANGVGKHALYPARRGDTLFVSTSRALIAVGAYTGEQVWRTPRGFLGWDDVPLMRISGFEKAIAYEDSLIAPAAAQGVVVGALQVPEVFEEEDNYGDLEIIRIIPERRLFAFDADSGAPLWDTRPPLLWDGESGGFPERTTVVGSPVIEGSRVLVPAARLRGRIEFFVGCYDLHTGELLWSTPVLTGQRPLNMFGRLVAEYVAPPVVVAGDRIVVQTQLGTVACLDLFTGDTLWHALYDQIIFTPGSYYLHGQLRSKWRNAPPAVVGSTVVAAPVDSDDLLGIELESGAVSWTLPHSRVQELSGGSSTRPTVEVLLGADERRVYLSGLRVLALETPAGLAAGPPLRRAWAYPTDVNDLIATDTPRPVIGDQHVYVPRMDELIVLERRGGRQVDTLAWHDEGNLIVSEGTLFTLSGYWLTGYFEWEAMVRRARAELAAAPEDPRRIGDLALLLYKRGLAALSAGDYRRAKRHLEDARAELGAHPSRHPALRETLHRVLRAEARNLRLAADPREALRRLRDARPLAPGPQELLDTLLEEQALLRDRDLDAWLAVLAELEERFAERSAPFLVLRAESDEAPWRGPIGPRVAALSEPGPGFESLELPVGLWVLVERSQAYARRRKAGDGGRELTDLHQVLAHYPGHALPGGGPAEEWAAACIGERVAGGAGEDHAPFEARAQALLALARERSDLELLERVPRLYPHSRAAGESNDARIELSLAAGDAERVAAIVLDELPEYWDPASASERQVRHLLRLAHLLGERGNLELRAGLTARMAASHPELEVDLPGMQGVRLKELARAWTVTGQARTAEPIFDHRLQTAASVNTSSPFEPVGVVPPGPGQGGVVQLMCDGARLYAYADWKTDGPLWAYWFDARRRRTLTGEPLPTDFEQAIATSPGRVHVAALSRVVTFERESDRELWTWHSDTRSLVAVAAAGGVVVAREDLGLRRDLSVYRLVGLDAASGVVLWSLELLEDRFTPAPVIGDGHLVLLPKSSDPAQIFDLYTGRATASFDLEFIPRRTTLAAWIEHGRVILPYFLMGTHPDRNQVVAHDLETGRRVWRVPLSGGPDGDRELSEIFSFGERHYLNLWPLNTARGERRQLGIYELDTRIGALATRPVAELPDDAEPIGIKPRMHAQLPGPYLFLLCLPREESSFTVRAIHLRYGERWRTALPPQFQRTPASDLPLPAVSESTVALAFPLPGVQGSRERLAQLMLLDRASGRPLAEQGLPESPSRSTFTLTPLGAALLVSGAKQLDLMR